MSAALSLSECGALSGEGETCEREPGHAGSCRAEIDGGFVAWSSLVHCGCGRHYSFGDWLMLPFNGIQEGEEPLDLRTCPCGSTRAVLVSRLAEIDREMYVADLEQNRVRLAERACHAFAVLSGTVVTLAALRRGG